MHPAPCFLCMDGKRKNRETLVSRFLRADTQIRTGDLILTKDALYLLSYISESSCPFFKGHEWRPRRDLNPRPPA